MQYMCEKKEVPIGEAKLFDWKADFLPVSDNDALFTNNKVEGAFDILIATDGKNKIFPVYCEKDIRRVLKVDDRGELLDGEKNLSEGEFLYIADKKDPPKYIVRDIPSALVVFNETHCSVVVYMNSKNLASVIARFPEAKIVVGAEEKDIIKIFPNSVIEIMRFGENREEIKLFEGKKFETVRDFFFDGGDINIMLKTGKKTRMAPLWWRQKRALSPSWIIDGMVPEGPSIVTLFSPSGVGKTFFVLDMALTISTGVGDFFGHKAKEGKVLYLCGEGEVAVSVRIQCWLEQHNIKDVSKVKFYLDNIPFSFDNVNEYEEFIEALEAKFCTKKPDIVIVDTMNLFMENDENSTQGASFFIKRLKCFTSKYNCTIILVHHTGLKEEKRERGSSAFKGAIDSELMLSNINGIKKVEQTKNRNGKIMEPIFLKFEEHDVEAYRDTITGETIRDCILVKTEAPKVEKSKGETFLVDFCVDRAENGENWMEFSRNDLVEFASSYWKNDVNVNILLNPNQEGKPLYKLLNKKMIIKVDNESKSNNTGKKNKINEIYRLNNNTIIEEIKNLIPVR